MKKGILKRKILSMMLVVSMLVNLSPVGAGQVFAAEVQEERVVDVEKLAVMETYAVSETNPDDFSVRALDDGTIEITGYTGTDTEIVVPSEIAGRPVTSIGDYAFRDCSNLINIKLPEGITNIGSNAFIWCSSLENIELPESLTSIEANTFYNCSSLKSIKLPEGITNIDSFAFYRCSSLENIKLPEGITSIGYGIFMYCNNLVSIELPESLTYIGDSAFSGCSNLESITLPEGITSIGSSAFYDCSSLKSITLPEKLTNIDTSTFYNCSSLVSILLPKSLANIGYSAFYGCSSLESITLPEKVTGIESYAFQNCSSLESVTVPESLTSIGYDAFDGCNKLKDVYYAGSESQWNTLKEEGISSGNGWLTGAILHIYIPVESISLSKTEVTFREIGAQISLTATVTPENATDKTYWSSSDESVVTVDVSDNIGTLTAVGNGTAIVTIESTNGVRAMCIVTVNEPKTGALRNPEYADWSYIYFGSYPQTEVTDSSMLWELDMATDYDSNGDVVVNGIKYHRITANDTFNCGFFGNATYRYFKWEPIKWRVLSNDGESLFIVADSALDSRAYHTNDNTVAWADSTIREWLNNTFYDTAFDADERKAIEKTSGISGSLSGYESYEEESPASDNIYLLSREEIKDPQYGFVETSDDETIAGDKTWSDYAYVRAGEAESLGAPIGFWLRTRAWAFDEEDGYKFAFQIPLTDYSYGSTSWDAGATNRLVALSAGYFMVMPAMHISLSSDQWFLEGELKVLTNPTSQSVKSGTPVTFEMEATGGSPSDYAYQWYYATSADGLGTKIVGATDSSYTIPADSVTSSINGRYYYCVVSDGYNSAKSKRALLTVVEIAPIEITKDLQSQSIQSGGNVGFTVTVVGGTPANYTCTWFYSSTESGAGSEITDGKFNMLKTQDGQIYSYQISSVTAGDEGYYYCIISDGQYSAQSSKAKLTVTTQPPGGGNTGDTGTETPGGGNTGAPGTETPGSGNTGDTGTETPGTAQLSIPKLTVKLTAVNAVKLTWNKVDGATGYYVYRRIKGEKNYKLLKTVTATSYDDKKLKKGKTYEYIVDAYNADTRTYSTAAVSKNIIGKLSKPKQNKIKLDNAKKKFTISWKPVKNAQKIVIYRSYNGGKYKKWKTVKASKKKVTYSFANFSKGTYRFKLKAYYKADGKTFYSAYSTKAYGIRRN